MIDCLDIRLEIARLNVRKGRVCVEADVTPAQMSKLLGGGGDLSEEKQIIVAHRIRRALQRLATSAGGVLAPAPPKPKRRARS